jgi:sugar/nucleoside kinase (ribokinase family)
MQSILNLPIEETTSAAEYAASEFSRLLACDDPDGPRTAIVVRAGPLGSITVSDHWQGWVPAYWRAHEQNRVVDVTGGGNAWLGGLCAGLSLTRGDMRSGRCGVTLTVLTRSVDVRSHSIIFCNRTKRTPDTDRSRRQRSLERR